MRRILVLLVALACGGGAARPQAPTPLPVPPNIRAAVDAPDRDADDKALDAGRKPDQFLTFFGVATGMTVCELGAGSGYTTELLARAVGPGGKVYAQNEQEVIDKYFKTEWAARIAKPVNANVVPLVRSTADPFPPEAHDLDVVVVHLLYHDFYWFGIDRSKMNAAVMKALKPGGVYGIVDHSGRPGSGTKEVQTLHRIEESELRKDVEAAGFKLAAESDILRHPEDQRDWSTSPGAAGARRGTSDRFVLKYVKP